MAICKLCSQDRRLIKAHSIPEAFFRELRTAGEMPLIISGNSSLLPKRAPIGVYDKTILCNTCEPMFGDIDNYGIEVLLKKFNQHFHPLNNVGKTAGFESSSVDSARLLQFLVSVLWRASVSSHSFYSKVTLGPHEILASHAANTTKIASGVFDAVLSRWIDENEKIPTTAILDPRPEKWSGINAYRVYLGKIVAYVKVDKRPFPKGLDELSLCSSPKALIVGREMEKSKDLRALKFTAKNSHENVIKIREAFNNR